MIRRLGLLPLLLLFVSQTAAAETCHPGVYQLARGDFAAALKSLSGAVRNDSTDASLLNSRGVAELLNRKPVEAIETFTRVLKLDPGFHEARFNRGVANLNLERFDNAAAEFEAVARDASDESLKARAAYHRALVAQAGKKFDDAEGWLRKALTLDASLAEANLYLGTLLERKGDFQAAGKAYREYLTLHPESPIALLRFGLAAHRAGYAEVATTHLRRVIQVAPSSVEAAEARKFLVMWE